MLWCDRGSTIHNCVINPIILTMKYTRAQGNDHSVFLISENDSTFYPVIQRNKQNLNILFESSFYPPSTLSQDSLSDQPTNCIFSSYTSVYFYCCHSRKLPSFFLIALIALKLDVLLTFLFPCLHAFSSEQPVTFVKYKLGSAYHTSITLKVEWNWNPLLFRLLPYPSS